LTPSRVIDTAHTPEEDTLAYGTDSVSSTSLSAPTIWTDTEMPREVQVGEATLTALWLVACWPWSAGTTVAASWRVCPAPLATTWPVERASLAL
jgi:hypothetical protein